MAYNPLDSDEKLRRAILEIHQELRDRLGNSVTLADVTEKFNEAYGLDYTAEQIAPFLDKSLKSRRQGVSSTTTAAGVASDAAAQASQEAREGGTDSAHRAAAQHHRHAAEAHRVAAAYHEKTAKWHDDKSAGLEPEAVEGCE